ncbi:MAG TPA: hypothetical protein VGS04_00440 [Nitrososphaerales archaeon]|nr:hypothetical protein [Nitrososphaerales archaeon]
MYAFTVIGAALLMVSPTLGSPAARTFSPPYSGTSPITNASGSPAVCNTGSSNSSVLYPSFANPLRGEVRMGGKVAMHRCYSTYLSGSVASLSLGAGFLGPRFQAHTGGMRNVSYSWRVNLGYVVTSNSPLFYLKVAVLGNLFDNTTNTWVRANNASVIVVLVSFHAVANVNTFVVLSFPVGLLAGHHYLFFTGIMAIMTMRTFCAQSCGTYNGYIQLNMFSKGHGSRALSMGIS